MSHPVHPMVLLVDDHRAVREAMAQLLEDNGMIIGGQASGLKEALVLLDTLLPDLVLIDLLPGDEGLRLVAELNSQGVPVVVCSSHQGPEYTRRALDAGARAYVAKGDAARTLPRILKDVLDGWVLISPRAAE